MTQVTLNNGSVDSSGSLLLKTNGTTTAVTVDTAQNVGVGVTPSAWNSAWKVVQIGAGANFVGRTGVVNQLQLIANAYFNGTNYIYQNTGEATQYFQTGGYHAWGVAPSGTAGNAISFTQAMTLDASGNLLVGQTSSGVQNINGVSLERGASWGYLVANHSGTSSGANYTYFGYNGSTIGSITQNGTTAVAYNTSSDYRLKHDIRPMAGALAKVAALKPVTYKWNADNSDGQGFIAHELAEVCPDAVHGEKDATEIQQYEISPAIPATYDEEGNELTPAVEAVMGEREVPVYQGIDTSFLVATLTAAIQEQQAIIQTLTARIEALEAK